MRRIIRDLAHNLRSGLALAAFRRRALGDFRIGFDQAVWLLVAVLLLEIVVDLLLSLPYPVFDSTALLDYSWSVVLFLFAAYLFSIRLGTRRATLQLLIVLNSATFLFSLLMMPLVMLSENIEDYPAWLLQVVAGAMTLWLYVVTLRAVYLVAGRRKLKLAQGVVILIAVWFIPGIYFGNSGGFWYSDPPSPPKDNRYLQYRNMDGEALMYSQPRLLQEHLATLQPGRPGETDLYFIAFAGYAMQDVFYREVSYAQRVMDERYGTADRSLLFINNLKTRKDIPLATATNLRRALHHIASLMDSEEDVLMLYLTSHGSRDHELAVDFWPLPLNDLTPGRLREMLDEAGIKWRVVVVSACYSGGFVEPLKDAHTLVATASAPDRQSFGCSNENDFTYFGEALFKDELEKSESMLQAFQHVPLTVSRRERQEELEPSRPQLFLPPKMEKKLQEMVRKECAPQSDVDPGQHC